MYPLEARLTKKLDELESEVFFFLENPKEQHFPSNRAAALLSRLSFIKSLLSAEISGNTSTRRLNHIATRISALESIFSGTDDPKTSAFRLKVAIVHKNLQELESMASESFLHQSAAKFRDKIVFTKSLLAKEDQREDLSLLNIRIAAVEEAFVHLTADDGTQPSFFSTSCHNEDVGDEETVALSSTKKIREIGERNEEDCYDVHRDITLMRSLLAAETKWKGEEKAEELDNLVKRFSNIGSEFAERNGVLDNANGGNESFSCSCTSSCFDEGEERKKQAEEERSCFSGFNETWKLCSVEAQQVIEGKSETTNSESGDGERRFGKLRAMGAMVGIFAIAAVGIAVGSFFGEKRRVHLVPT